MERLAPAPASIFIVDAEPLTCEGLARILTGHADLQVAGYAHDSTAAFVDLHALRADLVLISYDLGPQWDGPQLCALLGDTAGAPARVGMTSRADVRIVHDFLAAGASGVLLSDTDQTSVLSAARAALSGGSYLDARLIGLLPPAVTGPKRQILSQTEAQVLDLMARGESNKEIADLLAVSLGAVKKHVSSLLGKFSASSRTEAVALAARADLLHPVKPSDASP